MGLKNLLLELQPHLPEGNELKAFEDLLLDVTIFIYLENVTI